MSVSASAENLSTDALSCDGGSMCLELALEGERLCKAGDCRAGVAFFHAAIRAGTDDLRTLSAIYSQLGNAYFYLGEYNKAMQFHKHDLTLARTINDKLGEAKASGNLGNTLKVMGKFSDAIQCCKRHLEISRSLGDKLSEGRALYNLGNVYHAQGKHLGRLGQNDPGHFPQEVRECLLQAVTHYEENLELMRSLGDRQAMGRACGNLGNTCYLLGDFSRAIRYHTERLTIAREVGDKAAERRANSNLGNSHIFLGQFENAAEHYKRTLALAEELGDAAVEAQACYSLGNTYTLLREYRVAEGYHSRHLAAARKLQDRVGEGRACWSLGNAHAALGNHEKALYYAKEHYNISKELGDVLGMATAKMNVGDLSRVLGIPDETGSPTNPSSPSTMPPEDNGDETSFNALRVRRQSMEQLALIPITPDGKKKKEAKDNIVDEEGEEEDGDEEVEEMEKDGVKVITKKGLRKGKKPKEMVKAESEDCPAESFFELLSRCQSERMDEQRAVLRPRSKSGKLMRSASSGNKIESPGEEVLEVIKSKQPDRKGSQRAETSLPMKRQSKMMKASLPGLRPQQSTSAIPDDEFLDMIARVQNTRFNDQRAELPRVAKPEDRPKTLPDDDFFNLLMRAQSGRMEDQRATIPAKPVNPINKGNNNAKK